MQIEVSIGTINDIVEEVLKELRFPATIRRQILREINARLV